MGNAAKKAAAVVFLLCVWLSTRPGLGTELRICVRYPDQSAASGIKLQHAQLERPDPRTYHLGITDGNGETTVAFANEVNSLSSYGYGVHRFIVMPKDFRWEVSGLYYWCPEPWDEEVLARTSVFDLEDYEKRRTAEASNWAIGSLTRLAADTVATWEVTLSEGRDVQVTVVDQFGEALTLKSLSVSLNLEALSHTGWGAEIPIAAVQTDTLGRFTVPHAGDFVYSFRLHEYDGYRPYDQPPPEYYAPDVSYWTSTVRARLDEPEEQLVHRKCIPQKITVAVSDMDTGRPVPQASVYAVRWCEQIGGSYLVGRTDTSGVCTSSQFLPEHVVELFATKDGYETGALSVERILAAGTHGIRLRRTVQ